MQLCNQRILFMYIIMLLVARQLQHGCKRNWRATLQRWAGRTAFPGIFWRADMGA